MIDYGFVSQTFCKHLFRTQLAPSAPSSETSCGGSVKRGPHRAGEKIPDQKLSKTEFFFLSSSSLIVEMAPLRGRDTSRRTGLRGEIGMSFCGKNQRGRVYLQVRGSAFLPHGNHLVGGGKKHGATKHEVWDPAVQACIIIIANLLPSMLGAGMTGNVEGAGYWCMGWILGLVRCVPH